MLEIKSTAKTDGMVPITLDEEVEWLTRHGSIMIYEENGVRYRVLDPYEPWPAEERP